MRKLLTAEEKAQRRTERNQENERRKQELPYSYLEANVRNVELRFDEGDCALQVLMTQETGERETRYINLHELPQVASFLRAFVMRYNFLVRLTNEEVKSISLAELENMEGLQDG